MKSNSEPEKRMRSSTTRLTVFGCEPDEIELFQKLSPHFRVTPVLIDLNISEDTAVLAKGSRCISVGHKAVLSRSTIAAIKKVGVKCIITRSVGYNHIDLNAAKEMNIIVENTLYSPGSVADYTLMLILMALRGAKATIVNVEKSDFRLNTMRGKELRDLTVGVIGNGQIGKAVIDRLHGFGCKVLSCDKETINSSFGEILKNSDILTLHLPLDETNHHLISYSEIEQMKQGAILINTARGGLIDTKALIEGLEKGKLGGAALDVLEGEEGIFYTDCTNKGFENSYLSQLKQMPNVMITPHTAYYTDQALYDIVEHTLMSCEKFERKYIK